LAEPANRISALTLPGENESVIREHFERGAIDHDPRDDQLATQLGDIKWISRERTDHPSSRRSRCGSDAFHHRTALTRCRTPSAHIDLPDVDVESHAGQSMTRDLMTKAR
jgi:hypothetical protein